MRRFLGCFVAAGLLLALAPSAHAAAPPRFTMPPGSPTKGTCDISIAMSDGVHLYADLVSPTTVARRPTILTVTGYNKSPGPRNGACSVTDNQYAAHGYNRLTVDDRGTGNSEGTWDSWGARMQRDYTELLDWIVKQPWSDGTVGTTGPSYMGITSFLVAGLGHEERGDAHVRRAGGADGAVGPRLLDDPVEQLGVVALHAPPP